MGTAEIKVIMGKQIIPTLTEATVLMWIHPMEQMIPTEILMEAARATEILTPTIILTEMTLLDTPDNTKTTIPTGIRAVVSMTLTKTHSIEMGITTEIFKETMKITTIQLVLTLTATIPATERIIGILVTEMLYAMKEATETRVIRETQIIMTHMDKLTRTRMTRKLDQEKILAALTQFRTDSTFETMTNTREVLVPGTYAHGIHTPWTPPIAHTNPDGSNFKAKTLTNAIPSMARHYGVRLQLQINTLMTRTPLHEAQPPPPTPRLQTPQHHDEKCFAKRILMIGILITEKHY